MHNIRLFDILLYFTNRPYLTFQELLNLDVSVNEIDELIDTMLVAVRSELHKEGVPTGDVLCHKGPTATHYLNKKKDVRSVKLQLTDEGYNLFAIAFNEFERKQRDIRNEAQVKRSFRVSVASLAIAGLSLGVAIVSLLHTLMH